MLTRHLELTGNHSDQTSRYYGAEIDRLQKSTDSQMFGALQAIIAAGGGPGVLPWPDTTTPFPTNTALKVSAGTGLSVSIAAGAAITAHSIYEAIWLQQRVAAALSGLPANRGSGNPIYLFVAAQIQPTPLTPDIATPGNDSRETAIPVFLTSDLDVMDGGVLLASIQTGASSVTQVTDLRRALEFAGTSSSGSGGNTWRAGAGVPPNSLGADGEFYLNTANADIYKKAAGVWSFQLNIKGIGIPAGGASGSALVKTGAGDYATGWATLVSLLTGIGVGGVLSGNILNPGFSADMAYQSELDAVALAKANTVHTHTSAAITDFVQAARDAMENATGAPVADLPALRAVVAGDRQDKQQRLVESANALYRFDAEGAGTDDGSGVIAPTSGTGRWFKIGSAAGVTTLTELSDTPPTYAGQGGKALVVNEPENGVEFVALPEAPGGGGHVIQNNGASFATRTKLNFVGTYVVVTDDDLNDVTNITVSSGDPPEPGGFSLTTILGNETIVGLAVGGEETFTVNHNIDANFGLCEYPRFGIEQGIIITVLALRENGDVTNGAQFVVKVENIAYATDSYGNPGDIALTWTRTGVLS